MVCCLSVFSPGYFSDFLSARIVESRPMNPNQKRLLNYNSIGLPSTIINVASVIGCANCRPAYTFCSFFPLFYIFPNFLFSSFFVLVLPSFIFSVSFLSCLVFPSLFFSLSCVGGPVSCVPGVPASSRTFLLYFYFFTRMYSYVTRMLLVCIRM